MIPVARPRLSPAELRDMKALVRKRVSDAVSSVIQLCDNVEDSRDVADEAALAALAAAAGTANGADIIMGGKQRTPLECLELLVRRLYAAGLK